ncbi:alpha/beta fold hydrolase [Streptomyces sp. FH025]|uniref:alpha/beta fold hydrolase n=1 Tax=Streptomyces sp. FH025 TaxID=2815937 RepID=UPI001A9E87D9|nr:alpha/beta fold hydrolase [Streptomyces sp. FH025]MBO1417572.1 alpha/beta fold hydrolase [Streptomyces sp. FH025]
MPSVPTPFAPLARIVQGSGPGLLLAHGAGGSARDNWGPVLADLAAHRTVVAPDYPGSGDSPYEPGEPTLDELAERLVAAADEEGLETFDLAGFSLGAAVAVRIAARHPERIRSLLLLAGLTGGSARLSALSELFVRLDDRPGDLADLMLTVAFGHRWVDALPAERLAELREALESPQPDAFRQQFLLAARTDVREDLAALSVPTVVVSTVEDVLVQPSQHRLAAELIPGARLVELPCGHLPMIEAVPQLRDVLLEFVKA